MPLSIVDLLLGWWTSTSAGGASIGRRATLASGLVRSRARRSLATRRYDVAIPAALIVSPTSVCNLACPTCGVPLPDTGKALSSRCPEDSEFVIALDRFRQVLHECRDLGICHIVVVGGEPLLVDGLEELIEEHPGLLFSIFTNGRLLTHRRAARFAKLPNSILWLNVASGNHAGPLTELATGVLRAIEMMKEYGLFVGYTVTLTRQNYELFAKRATFEQLYATGARYSFYFDHMVELGLGASPRALGPAELKTFAAAVHTYAEERSCFAAVLPLDEEVFGGCGAAGRNFFHLNPLGVFEPCPFIPWSTTNGEATGSVLDVLRSPFFCELRGEVTDWETTASDIPCTYRAHSAEFSDICTRHGAERRY